MGSGKPHFRNFAVFGLGHEFVIVLIAENCWLWSLDFLRDRIERGLQISDTEAVLQKTKTQKYLMTNNSTSCLALHASPWNRLEVGQFFVSECHVSKWTE